MCLSIIWKVCALSKHRQVWLRGCWFGNRANSHNFAVWRAVAVDPEAQRRTWDRFLALRQAGFCRVKGCLRCIRTFYCRYIRALCGACKLIQTKTTHREQVFPDGYSFFSWTNTDNLSQPGRTDVTDSPHNGTAGFFQTGAVSRPDRLPSGRPLHLPERPSCGRQEGKHHTATDQHTTPGAVFNPVHRAGWSRVTPVVGSSIQQRDQSKIIRWVTGTRRT